MVSDFTFLHCFLCYSNAIKITCEYQNICNCNNFLREGLHFMTEWQGCDIFGHDCTVRAHCSDDEIRAIRIPRIRVKSEVYFGLYRSALIFLEHFLKLPLLWFFFYYLSCSNTALSEWKHPEKFSIWKCTVYKVIVSQMKELTLNHWNKSFYRSLWIKCLLNA